MLQDRNKRVRTINRGTKVAHGMMSMSGKEGPTKCLGGMVCNIDDARDVMHDNETALLPLVDGKVLDDDVMRVGSRTVLIDHRDCGDVIFIKQCGTLLGNAELIENRMKVLGDLGSMHSSNELGFSGTRSNGSLELGLVGNSSTGKVEHDTSKRAPCVSISSISGINEADKLQKGVLWEVGERGIQRWLVQSDVRKRVNRCTMPIHDAPVLHLP